MTIGIAICVVTLIMIITTAMTFAGAQVPQDNFVTFGKSIFGLSIKHPADWEVKEYDRKIRDDRIGGDTIASLCPKSVLEYPFRDSNITSCPDGKQVIIAVRSLPQNTTLKELINFFNIAGKFDTTGFKAGGIKNTTMAGFPAVNTTYTYLGDYKDGSEIIKVLLTLALNGKRAYFVAYSSPQLEFDDLLPAVQKMIKSLKISPMPPCNFVKDEFGGKCMLSASS